MSGISWTDVTWNPIRGCSRVSEGCRNCYAERIAARFSGPGQPYEGLAKVVAPRDGLDRVGGRRNGWTGEVRFVPEHLADPLKWRKPRRVFVNSMSDLFHEKLTNEQIAAVFGVMAACPQHTFQVLTKRAKRMREWFEWLRLICDPHPAGALDLMDELATSHLAGHFDVCHLSLTSCRWPIPNVHLGVSVENQAAADGRIPDLLATPAAVRWISAEPLLGALDLFDHLWEPADRDGTCQPRNRIRRRNGISWLVAGCESGPGARPCDIAWLRSLRDQCAEAGVPFWLKQATSTNPLWIDSNGIGYGHGSKRKPGGVIELPYLDRVQHAALPKATP